MEAHSFDALRGDLRKPDQLRPVSIQKDIAPACAGSCLISFGRTQVICAAGVEEKVPPWMRAQKVSGGWLNAEYTMLPYSTEERSRRPGASPNGRSMEIQRLIGRSLRAAVDLQALGARTLTIDCDVLCADGGTRTASVTGAYVALVLAVRRLMEEGKLKKDPMTHQVAAISVGLVKGTPMLDLCYEEDFAATTDANTVMREDGQFIELQSTAEEQAFSRDQINALLDLAEKGNRELFAIQNQALAT